MATSRFVNPNAGKLSRVGASSRFLKKAPESAAREPEKEIDETARQITESFRKIRERKDALFSDIMDADYYLVLCFQSEKQCAEWARKAGMPERDRYIDGLDLAERMGIKIEAPTMPRQKPFRIQERWRSIAIAPKKETSS
jgi:hypothetical protein